MAKTKRELEVENQKLRAENDSIRLANYTLSQPNLEAEEEEALKLEEQKALKLEMLQLRTAVASLSFLLRKHWGAKLLEE